MGIVEIRPRSGCYVKVHEKTHSNGVYANLPFNDEISPSEIFQLRETLERESAFLTCRNASQKELQKIEEHYMRMAKSKYVIGGEADRDFHYAIACASGNRLFQKIFLEIWNWGEKNFMWDAYDTSKKQIAATLATHKGIIQALKTRNPQVVSDAMDRHYSYTKVQVDLVHKDYSESHYKKI
jgi:DNA-binding FadR family transcriptional regulator